MQNTPHIFLKISPTQAESDHRKYVDTSERPLYTYWKNHVQRVSIPISILAFLINIFFKLDLRFQFSLDWLWTHMYLFGRLTNLSLLTGNPYYQTNDFFPFIAEKQTKDNIN